MSRLKNKSFLVTLFLVLVLTVGSIFKHEGLRLGVNLTESVKNTFYVYDIQDKNISKGDLFVFSYEGGGLYPNGKHFIKYAGCMAGEHISCSAAGCYCGEKYLGVAKDRDSQGRPLSRFEFDGTVPDGKIFATTPYERSYDSRYWGFVDSHQIIGKVVL